jgi:hypothetical protein
MDDALAVPKLPSRWASVGTKLPQTPHHPPGPSAGVVELPIDLAWSGDHGLRAVWNDRFPELSNVAKHV